MRFVLRQGTREVLVFSRNRLAWFEDEHSAGRFLADKLQGSRDNLARLRKALTGSPGLAHLATADPLMLVTKVAALLAQGELALLLDPDALAPWSWPFGMTASVTQYQAGAEGEGDPLSMEDDETEEQEAEFEDVKPDPVIPPIYPQIARIEASTLLFETSLFSIALDLLRWIGAEVPDESEVAELMTAIAKGAGDALGNATGAAMGLLLTLLGDPNAFGETEVGLSTRSVADLAGRAVHSAAGAAFARLLGLTGESDAGYSESDVGTAYRGLVGESREALHRGVDNTGEALKQLLGDGETADYDFGAEDVAEELPPVDEDGYDEAALLDDPVWLEKSWTGAADSPEEFAEETCIGREVVARVKAKDLPIGTMVAFSVHDELGRTLAEGESVGGTGGPGGLTTFRWTPPADMSAPKGGDVVQVYFKAKVDGDTGDVQSAVLPVRLDRAEDPTGACMTLPVWALHPDAAADGVDAELPVLVARYDHTVRLRCMLERFEPDENIRFEVNRVTGHDLEEVATVAATVEAADGLITAELPLPNLEGMSEKRPWHDLVFRAFSDKRGLMITSPPLRTVPPYRYTDNVDEQIDLTPAPWLRHANWVDADANPIHGFPYTMPSVTLRLAVEALRIDQGTPVEFVVYSAAEDAELDRVQGTVEDGVCVAMWTLQQQPGLEAGVYFEADIEDTNGPIRSPVIKARAGFSFSDSLGDDVQAEIPAPRFDVLRWTDADGDSVEVFAADLAPQTLYLAAKPAFVPAGSDLEFTIHRIEDDLEVGTLSATVGGAHVKAEWTLEEPVAAGQGFYFVAFHPAMDEPARGPDIKARARFALSDNTDGVIVPIPQPPKHDGALSGPRWQTRQGQALDGARQGHDTPCRLWVKAAQVSPGKTVTFTVKSLPSETVLQVLTTKVKAELDGTAWVDWEVPAHAQGAGLVFDAVVDGLDPLRSDTLELVANFGFSDNVDA